MKPASSVRELTCHVGSHSVTCHTVRGRDVRSRLYLSQLKLVIDMATPEGYMAKLT